MNSRVPLRSPKTIIRHAIDPPTIQELDVKKIEAKCQNGTVRYGTVQSGTVICSDSLS